jgi:hypothetical protein
MFFIVSPQVVASQSQSLDEVVQQSIIPHLDTLFNKLDNERLNFTLDGVKTFDKPHNFLPGKIAIAFSYLLIETPQDNPKFSKYMKTYRELTEMTLEMDNIKWGVYYYMLAVYRLQEAGLLEQAFSPKTLEKLKIKLDWRDFVSTPEYKLEKGTPTNYYGVAFSIARLRFLMGWETEEASKILLDIMLTHINSHSGEFGFSDETEGDGRFDRYSIVLIAELCARFLDTNTAVPENLYKRMRQSVDFILPLFNESGQGLQYGRSIGPYGDGIFHEILSVAAMMGMLNEDEMAAAYTFQIRVSQRLMNFWYDNEMQSINFWEKGRSTEGYRNKSRILDENLSLSHQHLSSYNFWRELGYSKNKPSQEFSKWLKSLPKYDLTWFAKGEYERAHLTVRDGQRIFELPIVGGGIGFNQNNLYFPIPYSANIIQGSSFQSYPQLIPRLTLEDGVAAEPLSFYKNITTEQKGSTYVVKIHQNELNRIKLEKVDWRELLPIKETNISIETTYLFDSGKITRTDRITPNKPLKNVTLSMEFAGFSEKATVNGSNVKYASGLVTAFDTTGYQKTTIENLNMHPIYSSPIGAMKTLIHNSAIIEDFSQPITVSWTLQYNN